MSIPLLLLLATLVTPPPAQRPAGALVIPRLSGPVTLDGLSDEPAWQAVPVLPATGHAPTFNAPPSERTEFRVAHDGEYLYAAGRLYDLDPTGIRATTLRRDEGSFSNDWFGINLDMFFDGETMVTFATNPAGVRTDVVYAGDAQNGADFNWNGHWDAAVRRTADGWFAEIRIPLSTLRFQERDGDVVMGMTVWRRIARRNEMITWPAVPPNWGWTSPFKASQAHPIVIEAVHSRTIVLVTPYVLGGGATSFRRSAAGDGVTAERTERRVAEAGVDVKYGLTSNVTVDVTVNPDFAQVEADDAQLNLSRASLFVPEKRLFFQERADVFNFGLGRSDRLFHSRRIGLSSGVPVPLSGGARLVGRARGWDVGALVMRAAGSAHDAADSYSVVRLRKVVTGASYIGAITTVRTGDEHDIAVGVDGRLRVHGEDIVAFQIAQTHGDAQPGSALERGFARVFWERRGLDGLTYALDITRAGSAFEPALGFMSRRDYTKVAGHVAHGWRPGPDSRLLRHDVAVSRLTFWSAATGAVESSRVAVDWRGETKRGHELTIGARAEREDVDTPLTLSAGMVVPAARYDFRSAFLTYRSPGGALRRVGLSVDGGGFYDGWQATLRLTPAWNASRHIELSGMAQLSHVAVPDRQERFTARLGQLRALGMLNSQLSAATLVQYSSLQDDLGVQLRVRYSAREGDDLHIVLNAGGTSGRVGAEPQPRAGRRTLLLKYSRALHIRLTQSRNHPDASPDAPLTLSGG